MNWQLSPVMSVLKGWYNFLFCLTNQTLAEFASERLKTKHHLFQSFIVYKWSLIYNIILFLLYNKSKLFGGKDLVIFEEAQKAKFLF